MKNTITPTTTVREVRQALFRHDNPKADQIRHALFDKEDQEAPIGLFYFAEATEAMKEPAPFSCNESGNKLS